MTSAYEISKQENIRRNKELLIQLGLDKPFLEPFEQPIKKPATQKKRKQTDAPTDDAKAWAKLQRTDSSDTIPDAGPRRSSRNAGKAVDYKSVMEKSHSIPLAYSSGVKISENEGPLGRGSGPRRYNPKTYGSIPGIQVGTWWESRRGCSDDAVHAPLVGGIAGGKQGAYSIALSGGYDEDVDLGYAFTYTGSGGRNLKGTKNAPKNLRTAPQSSDQTFENTFNKMLLRSVETGKPVRVIRGFKVRSKYAPSEGYRYDGLYTVEKAWSEKGRNPKGYLVCRFAFKRIPNQPPLPVRPNGDSGCEDSLKVEVEEGDITSEASVADKRLKGEIAQ